MRSPYSTIVLMSSVRTLKRYFWIECFHTALCLVCVVFGFLPSVACHSAMTNSFIENSAWFVRRYSSTELRCSSTTVNALIPNKCGSPVSVWCEASQPNHLVPRCVPLGLKEALASFGTSRRNVHSQPFPPPKDSCMFQTFTKISNIQSDCMYSSWL